MQKIATIAAYKLRKYEAGQPIDPYYIEAFKRQKRWRKIPFKVSLILQIMYSKRDKTHHLIMNRKNLEENYNFCVNIEALLDEFQAKNRVCGVRYALKRVLAKLNQIIE